MNGFKGPFLKVNFPAISQIVSLLKGSLELTLFLRRGADRYDCSPDVFWVSLLVPVLLIPFNLLQVYAYPEFRDTDLLPMLVVVSYQVIVSTGFILGGVWLLCWLLERRDQFFKFGTAYNWLSVSANLISLPYLVIFLLTPFSAEQLSHLLITCIGLFYCALVFTIRTTLNLSWLIAGLIAAFAGGCESIATLMLL